MKKILFLLSAVFICFPLYAQEWRMNDGRIWARENRAATLSKNRDVFTVVHTAKDIWAHDWCLSEGTQLPVQPGEVVELNIDAAFEGAGRAEISVITRDRRGEVVEWLFGSKNFPQTDRLTPVSTKFAIPHGVVSIEPRVVGYGPATVRVANFTARKIGNIPVGVPSRFVKENAYLKIEFSNDAFAVMDKRTRRVWYGTAGLEVFGMTRRGDDSLDLYHFERMQLYKVSIVLEPRAPEFTIRIESNGQMDGNFDFPPALTSKAGDRLIIPINEGIGYPVERQDINVRAAAYSGGGICMAFWGQVEDATGAGMMAILETPDDASIGIAAGKNKLLQVSPSWEPSMKEFRYARQLRYVFFDKGGHVAVCKRYRQYAKDIGLFVPFTEKVKKNPNIDKLLGAANIWVWDWDEYNNERDWEGRKLELFREMQSLGMTRILWSNGGSAEELAEMNKYDGVLTSSYDLYQDIMDPAKFDLVHVHGSWIPEAWDKDINWISPDGTWRKGWEVDRKDGTLPRIPCAIICDARAVHYARGRISWVLRTSPYTCRFIDTTVAAPWYECYHPDHPMTRSDSRKHKMELLKLVGDLGLVCGSETGHDAAVPYCDYFEGMLSLCHYRIDEAGRNMLQIIDRVPPQIEQFQLNPALRLPLWELVYHDCVVSHWYWGDYNNKLPKVWRKRDLFNVLYGTPPMYLFTRKNWNENKDKFVESYKTATHVARATAYAEMVDHRILSRNRLVQQTIFSNGVTVTVNFGEQPFTLPGGKVLGGLDWTLD